MRITGWHIDGFGIFRDYTVRDIPAGLTVFLGPNEAGKTTLLAFIRQMLFGFPDRSGRDRPYDPLRGGRHGGRLYLMGDDGEYVVERLDGEPNSPRVTFPDGSTGSEADLRDLLGSCDRDLFQSIYAFSLTELQDFGTLDAEGIHDRIFSAGIIGAGKSARDAIVHLQERQEGLSRPGGRSRIQELAAELDAVERRLQAARRIDARYEEALQREAACHAEVARLTDAIAERREMQERARRLTELWPVWYVRHTAEQELASVEAVDTVPVDGEARLSEISTAVDLARRQVAAVRREIDDVEARLGLLAPDDRLAAVAEEVRQLSEALALYRDRIVNLPQAVDRHRQALRTLDDSLRELGPGWDRARLAGFDRSIPRREEVRRFAEALEQAEETVARAHAEVRRADEQQKQAEAAHEALRQEIAALEEPAESPEEIESQTDAVRRLRATLAEQGALDARIRMAQETLRQLESLRREESLGADRSLRAVRLGLWAVAIILAVASIGLGNAVVSLLLAVTSVAVGTAAYLLGRRIMVTEVALEASVEEQRARSSSEIDTYEDRLRELADAIKEDAERLGMSTPPTMVEVETAAERIARLRELRDTRLAKVRALESADRELRERQAATDLARGALMTAARGLRGLQQEWETWKAEAGVPADLTPQGVLDFFDSVRAAREALAQAARAERDVRQIGQFVAAFERRAGELLARLDQPGDLRGFDLITEIERLRERVARDREQRQQRASLQDEAGRLRLKLDEAERELDEQIRRQQALFAEAGATDEASFRRRIAAYAKRQSLLQTIRECDERIALEIGGGADARAFLAELATGEIERWQRADEIVVRETAALSEERDRAIAARRDAEMARQALEESTEIADLELERAGLLAEIDDAVRQWWVSALAEGLIRETLARFERERQPVVLARASELFATITAGQYQRLIQQDTGLLILDRDGVARRLDSLSRGTAEQLYLSIRLGLTGELARHGVVLPLVMDDVLVNFDPERAIPLARALAEFAESQQVLIFTCHPETASRLREVAPESGQYLMSRYGGEIRPVPAVTVSPP